MKYWLSCICTSEPMWIRENPKFRLLHPILVFLKELKMNAVQLFHPGKKELFKEIIKRPKLPSHSCPRWVCKLLTTTVSAQMLNMGHLGLVARKHIITSDIDKSLQGLRHTRVSTWQLNLTICCIIPRYELVTSKELFQLLGCNYVKKAGSIAVS